MNLLRKSLITCAVLILLLGSLVPPHQIYAEQPEPAPIATELSDESNSSSQLATSQASDTTSTVFPEKIQTQWAKINNAIQGGDLSAVNSGVFELNDLRYQLGLEALEDYSLFLFGVAQRLLNSGDRNGADFFVRKGLLLSPSSPKVLFASLPLIKETGTESWWGNLWLAITNSKSHPALVLGAIEASIYPLLWALTIGLYLAYLVTFSCSVRDLLKQYAQYLPIRLRGLLAPPLILASVVGPCFLGPLWCLAIWGLVVLMLMPRRWLAFYSAAAIILWGALIPIRETLSAWIQDRSVQTMLSVSAGYHSALDRPSLERLVLSRPDDGVSHFVFGQLLRRLGDYEQSKGAFVRAESLLGKQPWTKVQRGLISYSQGAFDQADKFFSEAEELGLSSAAFYYDFSRIKVELLDTIGSDHYLKLARQQNAAITEQLLAREEVLKWDSTHAMAEISLPVSQLLLSALHPILGTQDNQDSRAVAMMPGTDPRLIMVVGVVLMLLFLINARSAGTRRRLALSDEQPERDLVWYFARLLPGGALILRSKVGLGVTVSTLAIFLIMPLIGWPASFPFLVDFSDSFGWGYCAAIALGLLFINLMTLPEERKR